MALTQAQVDLMRVHDVAYLAPKVRARVQQVLTAIPDVVCFETLRLPCLQVQYALTGASKQSSVLKSAHGYGLAADLVHVVNGAPVWDDEKNPDWWNALGAAIEGAGLTWGGKWSSPHDPPHAQTAAWSGVVPDHAAVLFASGGLSAVWSAYDV